MDRVTLTEEGIRAVLAEDGYDVRRITEDTYRGVLHADGRSVPFLMRVTPDGWIVAAVVRLARSPADEKVAHRLYLRMLELNQQLMMAKLSIDDDLDVVLSVEYPSAELDKSELSDVIRVLGYYANEHIAELEELASGGSPEPRVSQPPPLRRSSDRARGGTA